MSQITTTALSSVNSAKNFTGSLLGDVTGTQSETVVAKVGGINASVIASTSTSVLNSTTNNIPLSLVLRDSSGNFSAGTITANLLGDATNASTFTGELSGDVTGTQSSTIVQSVGGMALLI